MTERDCNQIAASIVRQATTTIKRAGESNAARARRADGGKGGTTKAVNRAARLSKG